MLLHDCRNPVPVMVMVLVLVVMVCCAVLWRERRTSVLCVVCVCCVMMCLLCCVECMCSIVMATDASSWVELNVSVSGFEIP